MNSKFFILREFAENKVINKEKLCFRYNISYKEYENFVDELLNVNKFIVPSDDDITHNSYKVTKKGIEYLEQYRVTKALILAAGLGTRMGDITKDNSKCLLKIKGEVLIERLICQLKSRGINDIVIVIGHVKEKFFYLKNKYDVKLIENPEYDTKNTIASFHCAVNDIKNENTYITVGDIYLNENLFHTYEIEPFYAGPFTEDCSNEWTYIYDENHKVNGVSVGGLYDYTIGGFSFHSKNFINSLIELVESDYKKSNTEKYYWEDVLVNNIPNLPEFYVHKIPSNVLQEFDTKNDLDKLNDESLSIKEIVKKVFDIKNDDFSFKKTSEGLTNNSYLLSLNDEKYIIRLPGISTGLLINRKNEKNNYDELEKYNFTDKIIYFDENTGLKITRYFDNAKTIDIQSIEDLVSSISLLKKLHSLNITTKNDVNITNVFKFYMSIMNKYKMKFIYDDFSVVLKKCNELINYIESFKRPNTFTHGDAGYCNVLKTCDGYKLIDFEFAGMADPLTDIALFGFCSNMSIEETLKLIDIYKNCKVENLDNDTFLKKINIKGSSKDIENLIVAYMAIDTITCALWHIIRVAITDEHSYNYDENYLKMFNMYYDYVMK